MPVAEFHSLMSSRFMHAVTNGSFLLFLRLNNIPFSLPFVNGRMDSYLILTIANRVSVNKRGQTAPDILLYINPLIPFTWESQILKLIEAENTILVDRYKVLEEAGVLFFHEYKVSNILMNYF